MSFKTEIQPNTSYDWLKWLIIALLIVAGLIANYYCSAQPWPLRILGSMVLMGLIAVIAAFTHQGKLVIRFARESRVELRKVYWPTRQETMQTTLFVAIMVIVLALMLWGIDSILMWLIGWLTGQRG